MEHVLLWLDTSGSCNSICVVGITWIHGRSSSVYPVSRF
jgi:hypothetical protein